MLLLIHVSCVLTVFMRCVCQALYLVRGAPLVLSVHVFGVFGAKHRLATQLPARRFFWTMLLY